MKLVSVRIVPSELLQCMYVAGRLDIGLFGGSNVYFAGECHPIHMAERYEGNV
jgi:hypothetical protein